MPSIQESMADEIVEVLFGTLDFWLKMACSMVR
jgi:hypothetical protein